MQNNLYRLLWSYLPKVPIFLAMTVKIHLIFSPKEDWDYFLYYQPEEFM